MKTAICSKIMALRHRYAKRRVTAHRLIVRAARTTSRRERMRKGKMTSMKSIMLRIRGELRRRDEEERRFLEEAIRNCKENVEKSMACFDQVLIYIDDIVIKSFRDAKYKAWEMVLDVFLKEVKNMVHYSIMPTREEIRTVDLLIRMLSQMRIAESITEQTQLRWGLEDGLTHLLEDANVRMRRMGL